MNNSYLEETLRGLGLVTKKVQAEFGRLSGEQLNWRPSAQNWSIAQCLDHIMVTNQRYFPVYEAVRDGRKAKTFWENLPVLPGLWGRLIRQSVHPGSARKLKAPAIFKPASSHLPASVIPAFEQHQQELIKSILATDAVEHTKTIVTSPVSHFITYSLKDCILICAFHEERHFMQARRVLNEVEFPRHLF